MKNCNYRDYWEKRYHRNGTSGAGSYGILAEFKGEVINNLIKEYNIFSTIEFGCGDGNQIQYINYKDYIGFDIAPSAINRCINLFAMDKDKTFLIYDPQKFNPEDYNADMVVCLDVLYHIMDEDDFIKTLNHIFMCSNKLIVLYTIISFDRSIYCHSKSIKNRSIFNYISQYDNFKIKYIIKQKYPKLASSDFVILEKINL